MGRQRTAKSEPNRRPLDIQLRLSDLRESDLWAGRSLSLDEAEAQLREFGERLGFTIGETVVENDVREDGTLKPKSAWQKKRITLPDGTWQWRTIRPAFRTLLKRMQSGISGGFLTVDLDRTARDQYDLEDLVGIVQATGANIRSLTGNLQFTDGGTEPEIEMARYGVMHAARSSSDTSRRVRMSRGRDARLGFHSGGSRPYGFRPVPTGATEGYGRRFSVLVVVEEEARIIRRMAEQVRAGITLKAIARDLNAEGVPTAKGGRWDGRLVRDILVRPLNAGHIVYDGERLPDLNLAKLVPAILRSSGTTLGDEEWVAPLTVDEWAAVMDVLDDPRRTNAGPGRAPKYLGTNLFACCCGGPMSGHATAGDGRTATYRCNAPGKSGHMKIVLASVDRHVRDAVLARLARDDAAELYEVMDDGDRVNTAELRRIIHEAKEALRTYARLEAEGRRTAEQVDELTQIKMAEIGRAQAILDMHTAAADLSPIQKLVESGEPHKTWDDDMTLAERREVVRRLVRVVIHPHAGRRTLEERIELAPLA